MRKRLLLTTLLLSFGLFASAEEGQHSQEKCDHPSHSDGLPQEAFNGLDNIQRSLLVNLAERQTSETFPMARCFAPGTPQATIDQYNEDLPVAAFRINGTSPRWTSTATDGGSIARGVPITLRWSFLPDGVSIGSFNSEPVAPSNLKAFLNGIYGNQSVWQPLFQQVFDRWSELSGITYVFESNDDGAVFPNSAGVVGVRGDVRIGGHFIDGPSSVLAYNFFPTTGDMVIDTGDTFFNNTSSGSLGLRNVLAHEAGHGLGFDHVCPVEQKKLMEPFVSSAFNGPQHDDILAVQRNYGDNFGQIGTTGAAANLGALGNQSLTVTNASIDGAGEVDFFKFSLPGSSKWASVTLVPVGQTYLEGVQSGGTCTAGVSFNSKTIANLNVQLIDSNGTTVLGTASGNAAGLNETLTNILLTSSGPYYIRVAGDGVDNVQLYDFTLTIADATLPVPVLVAEPATTPGTSNTISWSAIQAVTAPAKTPSVGTGSGTIVTSQAVPSSGGIAPDAKKLRLAKAVLPAGATPITTVENGSKESSQTAPVLQNILTETFEGVFPGSTWTRYGNPTWDDVSGNAHGGSWSGWCGASSLSPAGGYVDNMQSWMVYGPFSLADATSASLRFWYKNDSEEGFDFLQWMASTNGVDFNGYADTGLQSTWAQGTLDLAAVPTLGNLVGKSQVWIAIMFFSDDSVSGLGGAYVDDIVIEKDVPSLADLTPYQPANWNDKIPVGTTQLGFGAAHNYTGNYYDHQTLYFNWASINQGASATGSYTVRAEVTGTGGGTWTWTVTNNPVNEWFASTLDQAVGPLAAGAHTFKVWVDYNNNITEASEANNYYERTINVTTQVPIEYYAESANNSSFTSPVGSGWISATQYTFQNLTPGQTYWYRVKARQGANQSAFSTSVSSQQQAVPAIAVGPSSQNFGTTQVGLTVDRTFSVTNSGSGTLSGSASVPSPFSVFSGGTYNLSAGQSQSVVIRYTPLAAGTHNANVTFTGGVGATTQVSGIATNANTPPTITITLPTSNSSLSTNQNSIGLGGTASDNLGVVSVTWSNNRGGSGTATGTTSWSVPAITLQPGTNVLTVTAQDASLSTGTDSLSVVFIPPNVFRSFVKTNGNFQFTLDGEVGRTYVVQYSTNLVSWPTLVTLTNTTGTMIHTDPGATSGRRFYRSLPQ